MSNDSPGEEQQEIKAEPNIDNDENIVKTEENTTVIKEEESSKDFPKPNIDFEPLLYSFDISPFSHSTPSMSTQIFDDPLRHDHALGIIWLLVSKQGKCPGISQLHWGLQFLQTLQGDDGTYPNDVFVCIHLIEESLLKQYAKLGNFIQKINESIIDDKSTMAISTPKVSYDQGTLDTTASKDLFESIAEGINKINASDVMSLTYNEMLSRGSLPCIEEKGHEHIQTFIKDLQLPNECVASMSKAELVQFIDTLRKEHVEKIKKEVNKICSLENVMQDLDKTSFKAYMTDDLIKHFKQLGNSDTEDNM